ncbi:MAG: hypothetical protein JWR90_2290 [Marmoricola sp.]|jgi:hypothetical protein|nr:hypothetical protein [Marmoricola sp.]
MQPLGFGSTSLWVSYIGPDDRPTRFVIEITDSDAVPTPGGGGRDAVNTFDRTLASRPLAAGRGSALRCHPVHVANDVGVWAVTPDDLAA